MGEVTELRSGWLDKRGIADHFAVSVSFIEKRTREGMPHALVGNRVRFKIAEAESWLERHGYLTRKGQAA